MKDKDFEKRIDFVVVKGGLIPHGNNAEETMLNAGNGEILSFKLMTQRDMQFHRCYFSIIGFIYEYMPLQFRNALPKKHFYNWLKVLRGDFKEVFSFSDGKSLIEYESISFTGMDGIQFKEYVANQMPFIRENVIGAYFEGDMLEGIWDTIEEEYVKFFNKLV